MAEEILRDFGPQDPDDVAELVPRVGVHNKASRVIEAVRKAYPREYVTAASKPVDKGRTEKLDAAEVEEVAANVLGENFDGVRGAAVRGPHEGRHEQMTVIISYAVKPSGRTARAALAYHTFASSQAAYDSAVSRGELIPGVDDDPKALQQMIRTQEAKIRQLQSEQPEAPAGVSEEDVARIVAEAEERIRAEVAEEAAEAEEAPGETEEPPPPPPVFDDSELTPTEGEPVLGYAESLSADDLVQRIEGGHYDAAQVEAIKAVEAEGKKRKTVLAAVPDQPDQG
jgi:hypothetical protein